jgi:hypothetical protein
MQRTVKALYGPVGLFLARKSSSDILLLSRMTFNNKVISSSRNYLSQVLL